MQATNYDFEVEQGSSFKFAIIYKNCEKEPIDLTNWCARITVKTNDNETLFFTTTNTDLSLYKFYIDGPEGKLTWLLPASTTNDWAFRLGKYDLEIESPDDFYTGGGKYTTKLLYGTIKVIKRNSSSSSLLSCQP